MKNLDYMQDENKNSLNILKVFKPEMEIRVIRGIYMKMVFPNIKFKEKAVEFIQEFYDYKSKINGSGALDSYLEEYSYELWLDKILDDIDIANIKGNRVPALTYFYVREEDEKIIGMINIRLALNDFLKKEGGHIGYCVRPTMRNNGYATTMLGEAIKISDKVGIKEIFITCDKSNIASNEVIKKYNVILDEEFYSEIFGEIIRRYIIYM